MYKLHVKLPNAGSGVEVNITGLGTFENGKVYDISKEQAEAFRVANGHIVAGEHGEPKHELGPTLVEAFKDREGIKVEKTSTGKE